MTAVYRPAQVLTRSFGGTVLLASPHRDGVDELEGPAAAIWRSLPATLDDLATSLSEAYEAPVDVIERDVRSTLEELVRRGWVIRVDA